MREVRRRHEASRAQAQCSLPALAQQQGAGAELTDGTREGEGLEGPCLRVVVEKQVAHARSRSLRGSDSTSFFRSAERSTVVTSVNPSFATTTTSFTP